MTCPTELNLSMYADGALAAAETAETQAHLATCSSCSAKFAALRAEADNLTMALAHDADTVVVPLFERPVSYGAPVALTALLCAALTSAVPALLGTALPLPFAWFDPFDAWGFADLAVRTAIYLAQHGDAIMTSIIQTAATVVTIGLLAWLAFAVRKRFSGSLVVLSLACMVVALPRPAHALEIRYDQNGNVVIPASETIADTLIAIGENVEVDGNVDGDLIAFGKRVSVRGHVGGQVFTGGQTVTIDGEVDDTVLGMAETLGVSSGRIGRNLFGIGSTVTVSPGVRIEQNAVLAAERADVAGPIGRDVFGFVHEMDVSSTIGGRLEVFAERVTLLSPARVAGSVTAHVPEQDGLTISPGAVVGGDVKTDIHAFPKEESRYAMAEFYMHQVLRFAAALVTGVIVLLLVPGLRRVSLRSAGDTLVAGSVGLVALVATPIVAVLIALTVIGIPIALLGVMLWLAGIYLAKVVLAHVVGARLLEASGTTSHFAVALALGLALIVVAVNVPFVGTPLNVVLTSVGLGLLALFMWRVARGEPRGDEAAG